MTIAYLGIGSNVGDRVLFVRRAIDELADTPGVSLLKASSLFETSPVGGPPQRSFVNAAVQIETAKSPRELLVLAKEVEFKLGREDSEIRWGPRIIDVDVLIYGEEKIVEPDLEIPHPRISERKFVLVPLLEINPDVSDPWGTPYSGNLDEAEGEVELLEGF